MYDSFYLIVTGLGKDTWYQLVTTKTHYCISCGGDLYRRLQVLKDCVKRHRTEERLLRALERLDGEGKVSPATYEQRSKYYRAHGKDYEDLIHSVVRQAYEEALEEDKANNPLNKARNRLKKAGGIKTIVPVKEEKVKTTPLPKKDSTPFLRKKPKVFKHK